MKSFDEKLYICETCHKHLYNDEIPCKAVYNKMPLDPIADELKDLNFQENCVLKIAIMHAKVFF